VGGHLADSLGYGGLFAWLGAVTLGGTCVGLIALVRQRRGAGTRSVGEPAGARPEDRHPDPAEAPRS
jgi:hypothetical protein